MRHKYFLKSTRDMETPVKGPLFIHSITIGRHSKSMPPCRPVVLKHYIQKYKWVEKGANM